jgi:hypothetical protein
MIEEVDERRSWKDRRGGNWKRIGPSVWPSAPTRVKNRRTLAVGFLSFFMCVM